MRARKSSNTEKQESGLSAYAYVVVTQLFLIFLKISKYIDWNWFFIFMPVLLIVFFLIVIILKKNEKL